jgi:hypothetical protein
MADEQGWDTRPLPPCVRCNGTFRLVGIERTDKPHEDLYTFECPRCGHLETRTVCTQ